MSKSCLLAAALCLGMTVPTFAGAQETLEHVVVIMRHGVRPPTKDQPLPPVYTSQAWPKWDVPAGWLTAHGEKAINRLGAFDRQSYGSLLGNACPEKGRVRVVADTDQRTLKTASAYADTLLPGCAVTVENAGDGQVDARFSPFEGTAKMMPGEAEKAAQDALPTGGLARLDADNHTRLALLTRMLDCHAAACDLTAQPTRFADKEGRVKIAGGLDTASTLAQILLLEYTDGKPMDQVGWGKVTPAQIADLSVLHALEFNTIARPKAIARFGAKPLLDEVKAGLFGNGAVYTVLVGHDTNIAQVAGALDINFQAPGLAQNDPAPGGALIFEKWRDASGAETVRVRYRAQSLEEIRNLTDLAAGDTAPVTIPACGGESCEAAAFQALIP
ncbi:MAG: histidine-type phosphatase [Asticcacaulis sp.]|uniref:histidine-type phosphatase n=1 Tax=Asticcacaulis sp. TaxID=1872648 RepID=UPI0039E3F446